MKSYDESNKLVRKIFFTFHKIELEKIYMLTLNEIFICVLSRTSSNIVPTSAELEILLTRKYK